MKKFGKKILLEFILILLILAVSALGFVFLNKNGKAKTVVVSINGQDVAKYSLNVDTEVLLNSPETNGSNTLKIENSTASIISADCPDQICQKTGAIKNIGETIVCLPHKLVVRLEG